VIACDSVDVDVVCFHYCLLLLGVDPGGGHERGDLIAELWGTIGGCAGWKEKRWDHRAGGFTGFGLLVDLEVY